MLTGWQVTYIDFHDNLRTLLKDAIRLDDLTPNPSELGSTPVKIVNPKALQHKAFFILDQTVTPLSVPSFKLGRKKTFWYSISDD